MPTASDLRRSGSRLLVPLCLVLICGMGLSGCSRLRLHEPPVIVRGLPLGDAQNDPERVAEIAAKNREAEEYYRQEEWPLHIQANQAPELAIALSGGGIRSAVFSLGVLSGLHDLEVFPQRTDLLSAVSGGGYIASWFYAQQILHQTRPEDLLNPEGQPQRDLGEHADFVEIQPRHPASIPVALGSIGPMSAVNLAVNGVFGWHGNTPLTSPYYMYRFQKTFFAGGAKGDGTPTVDWEDVRKLISPDPQGRAPAGHLPNFILNTTAALGYTASEEGSRGFNTVYEFTPQRFGSEGMGFYCYEDPGNPRRPLPSKCEGWRSPLGPLERIAVTSGAAFNSSVVDGLVERAIVSGFNLDLGHFFPNPNAPRRLNWELLLPFPFYRFTRQYRLDSEGRRILLTDGGHSDNLGVYSLIRRAPAKILIVDGEQDPDHKFKAYRRLRKMLLHDLNLVFSIPEIDDPPQGPGPVYRGKVGTLVSGTGAPRDIDVFYFKLPARAFLEAECACKSQGGAERPRFCAYLCSHTKFPFDGTFTDQSYDKDQFAAYRDLGLWVVEKAKPMLEQGLGL